MRAVAWAVQHECDSSVITNGKVARSFLYYSVLFMYQNGADEIEKMPGDFKDLFQNGESSNQSVF